MITRRTDQRRTDQRRTVHAPLGRRGERARGAAERSVR